MLIKCLIVLGLTIIGFFTHQTFHLESATIALGGAFLILLLTSEHVMEDALSRVEWTTIFFFVGLFTLVGALEQTGVITLLAEKAMELTGGELVTTSMLILWLSAICSAFLDNIPFVATMIDVIDGMGQIGITYGGAVVKSIDPIWWSLALGACLGGNGTLIGASANLIVAGLANKEGEPIRFVTFLKYGFPIMILTVAISTVYVYLRYFVFGEIAVQ